MNPTKRNPRARNDYNFFNRFLKKDMCGALSFNSAGNLDLNDIDVIIQKLNFVQRFPRPTEEQAEKIAEDFMREILAYLNRSFPGENFTFND